MSEHHPYFTVKQALILADIMYISASNITFELKEPTLKSLFQDLKDVSQFEFDSSEWAVKCAEKHANVFRLIRKLTGETNV